MKNTFCNLTKYPELSKSYRIIAFDWDGTAVNSRNEDIPELIQELEKLMNQGVFIVIITGTNFENIDKQLGIHKKSFKNFFSYFMQSFCMKIYAFSKSLSKLGSIFILIQCKKHIF